jgi:predicted RNase H-like HicB family nuclease
MTVAREDRSMPDLEPARQGTLRQKARFAVILTAEAEGGYSVFVPALPGCFSEGDSEEEALANIREAIACHLEPPTAARTLDVLVREVEVEL